MYIGNKKKNTGNYHLGINAFIFSFPLVKEINVQSCITIYTAPQTGLTLC